ncbi:MAG: hypothetical protein AAF787_23370 [Chloroflexota bacterium]
MSKKHHTPLEPIEIHYYYACSWIINHHGLNQLADLASIAEELDVKLRVRQMFTDQYGYLIYPFTIKVPDEATLQTFMQRVAAGVGMEEWYIVNMAYYDKGVDFVANYRTVLSQMPLWEQNMRKYADHNAQLYEQHKSAPPEEAE